MTIIFFVSYIGLTALAGFAKGFLALKVIGAVNVGFMLIASNYVLAIQNVQEFGALVMEVEAWVS